MAFENVFGLWQEGLRRLERADPDVRPALERVVDALVLELRRQLGGPFTTDELAALYLERGTDWCFEIAVRVAPRGSRVVRVRSKRSTVASATGRPSGPTTRPSTTPWLCRAT